MDTTQHPSPAFQQLATLRGKGRHFDEHGVWGYQKVVCTGSYERLIANAHSLFPGAKITRVVDTTPDNYAGRFLAILSRPNMPDVLATSWISKEVGTPWRQ
jgi:hypothetical protein